MDLFNVTTCAPFSGDNKKKKKLLFILQMFEYLCNMQWILPISTTDHKKTVLKPSTVYFNFQITMYHQKEHTINICHDQKSWQK